MHAAGRGLGLRRCRRVGQLLVVCARLLQQVPEPKAGKNRMHLDLQVADVHSEVERLIALGASLIQPPHDDAGFLTAILRDPQGNEFCLIKPRRLA